MVSRRDVHDEDEEEDNLEDLDVLEDDDAAVEECCNSSGVISFKNAGLGGTGG